MERVMKDCYKVYSGILSEEDFNKFFGLLQKEKQLDFARASLMYQRATECRSCDPEVCIALLCSAVEAISGGGDIIFKDWLLKNKLNTITNKDEGQLRDSLNQAYQDYLNSEEKREGITYNFRKFLTTYCPERLKNPPITVYKGEGELFEIALKGLYSRFRSLFLHEGIGYAGTVNEFRIDEETGEEAIIIAVPLLLKVNGKPVSMELTEITDWFANVVKESLIRYLSHYTQK